jgi:acyl dehydratase
MSILTDWFEDIVIGERVTFGVHTFSADEIKAFARQYDPQPFHLGETAAAATHFGALCASGFQSAAWWMRLMVDHRAREYDKRIARGDKLPLLGPSPGFRELRWLKPVYVGDTIRYAMEAVEKRLSGSRPGWGLMMARNTAHNQCDELVMSWIATAFIQCRSA